MTHSHEHLPPSTLEELERLAEAATGDAWYASGSTVWAEDVEYGMEPDCCGQFNRDGSCCGNAIPRQTEELVQREIASACDLDAAFIAAANPQTITALVAEVRRLREALAPFATLAEEYEIEREFQPSLVIAIRRAEALAKTEGV